MAEPIPTEPTDTIEAPSSSPSPSPLSTDNEPTFWDSLPEWPEWAPQRLPDTSDVKHASYVLVRYTVLAFVTMILVAYFFDTIRKWWRGGVIAADATPAKRKAGETVRLIDDGLAEARVNQQDTTAQAAEVAVAEWTAYEASRLMQTSAAHDLEQREAAKGPSHVTGGTGNVPLTEDAVRIAQQTAVQHGAQAAVLRQRAKAKSKTAEGESSSSSSPLPATGDSGAGVGFSSTSSSAPAAGDFQAAARAFANADAIVARQEREAQDVAFQNILASDRAEGVSQAAVKVTGEKLLIRQEALRVIKSRALPLEPPVGSVPAPVTVIVALSSGARVQRRLPTSVPIQVLYDTVDAAPGCDDMFSWSVPWLGKTEIQLSDGSAAAAAAAAAAADEAVNALVEANAALGKEIDDDQVAALNAVALEAATTEALRLQERSQYLLFEAFPRRELSDRSMTLADAGLSGQVLLRIERQDKKKSN